MGTRRKFAGGWIRIDKDTGEEEAVSENRVREVTQGYFKDVELVMATGTVPTPFAVFYKAPVRGGQEA